MATLLDLVSAQVLVRLDPQLGPRRQEYRAIYLSRRAFAWLSTELQELGSTWNIEVAPNAQLDAFVEHFASGGVLTHPESFHEMTPLPEGVWVLKTADIRVFGFFHRRDCFVAAIVDSAEWVKRHNLYHGYIGETIRFRDSLDLDEPKFIAGGDPRDVVSNFDRAH